MTVIDASAVLALVFEKLGCAVVLASCRGALLSAVNLYEGLYKVARRGLDPVAFDAGQARVSVALHPRLHGTDTSVADRACLSPALATGCAVLTGDTDRVRLGLDIDVRPIR